MDKAHRQAEKDLVKLVKKIEREYRRAEKGIEHKAREYFEMFESEDKKMFSLMDRGVISRDDYSKWRQSELMTGQKWKDTLKSISKDYAEVDSIAVKMTNDHMDDTYANNFNFGTYEIEKGSQIATNFTLYNRDTIQRLLVENPELLPKPNPFKIIPKAEKWNMELVNSAFIQGLLQGDSIEDLAKRLRQVAKMNVNSSIRNARTMTTRAENYGRLRAYDRAESLGIDVMKKWVATLDHRTRDSHVDLDGEVVKNDETFSNGLDCPGGMGPPEEVYNCFVAETSVAIDSDIVRSYKHLYEGELLTIKSASGVEFTCTPNHPILTRRGWVKANALNEGDNLVVTIASDNICPWGNPNIKHIFPRFDTLHKFVNEFRRERTSTLRVNFHGDIPTTDVEVVTLKSLLRNNGNVGMRKRINKFLFKLADSSFLSQCSFMKHFRSIFRTSLCFISRRCKTFSFFLRSLGHSDIHRLRPIALLDSYGMKPLKYYIPRDSEFLGKCLNGFTGIVFADDIINIDVCSRCTHVYNLQSVNGYYFVNTSISKNGEKDNGIKAIAHNCRCTLVAEIKGVNYKDERHSDMLKDISYDEWKRQARERLNR